MIVYHYLNRKYGLESLRKRRLRISIVHELKDPFEHRAVVMPENLEPFFDQMLEDMAKPDALRPHGQGIICFSETCESPVMWSMYADNHEGVCLGFEIPEQAGALHQVQYVGERVPAASLDIQSMLACLIYKFDGWEYERERRLLIALQEEHREGQNYFAYYEPRMALRSVAVGYRSSITREEISRALGDLASSVHVYKVRRSLSAFNMVVDDRPTAWCSPGPKALNKLSRLPFRCTAAIRRHRSSIHKRQHPALGKKL